MTRKYEKSALYGSGISRLRSLRCDHCGAEFATRRSGARWCSIRCMTTGGAWSYRASHPTNERAFGVTKA